MSLLLAASLLVFSAAPNPAEARFEPFVDAALAQTRGLFPVPKALVFAVMRQESAFDPRAVSRAGARGLMQLMPATAARVGLRAEDLFEPAANILGGARLLAALLRFYSGDVVSALVGYNAHPRAAFAPVPQNGETPDYCRRVLGFFEAYLERFPVQPTLPPGQPRMTAESAAVLRTRSPAPPEPSRDRSLDARGNPSSPGGLR